MFSDAHDDDAAAHSGTPHRTIGPDLGEAIGAAKKLRSGHLGIDFSDSDGTVAIAGQVIDMVNHAPVPNVEVVFKSPQGEASATSGPDGKYRVAVAPGTYRAFVRDDSVLSVGTPERIRLPGFPTADVAGVPDEALMPVVVAAADVDNIDLSVMRGGAISGTVTDASGHPIEGVVLRARGGGGVRPALGTDRGVRCKGQLRDAPPRRRVHRRRDAREVRRRDRDPAHPRQHRRPRERARRRHGRLRDQRQGHAARRQRGRRWRDREAVGLHHLSSARRVASRPMARFAG